jgi:hypothetical protein
MPSESRAREIERPRKRFARRTVPKSSALIGNAMYAAIDRTLPTIDR